MCSPRCVAHARLICCSAQIRGLLARYVPLKKSELSVCVQISFVGPNMSDGTLLILVLRVGALVQRWVYQVKCMGWKWWGWLSTLNDGGQFHLES